MMTRILRKAALLCIALLPVSIPSAAAAQEYVPEGIDSDDWGSIRAAYDAGRHAATKTADGFEARNPGQGWALSFDGRGFRVEPDASEWSWGLELVSYGFDGNAQFVGDTACASAEGGRVAYSWDDGIEEWFVNDTRGFEHGFTVHERPVGGGNASGELTLQLRVRGDLAPKIQDGRRGVAFVDTNGSTVLNYSGLTVFDADGKTLRSWFELAHDGLRISVDERAARYPLTIDPLAQQAYLKASNTEAGDNFGRALAISNDTIVVGALAEDSSAIGINGDQANNGRLQSGAAYVFVRSGSVWTQQAYLKASNADQGDFFGRYVAISNDTIVVAALDEDSNATGIDGDQTNNGSLSSGAVYVFARSGSVWTQQAYLKASNTSFGDFFGSSLAVSGNTIVVGANREDSSAIGIDGDQVNNTAPESGAAYVFVRSGSVWTQQAYLKASNTEQGDFFGWSLAVSGDTIVVGALDEDSSAIGIDGDQANNTSSHSGAAYVFARSGSVWSQQAYLKASNADQDDIFGSSMAISGDTLVVGAPSEGSNATGINGDQVNNTSSHSGAAYVFARTGLVWSQQAYLKASNTDAFDTFGSSVATSNDTVVVGARFEDSSSTGIDGDQADNAASSSGAAYVFVRSGSVWSQQAYLKASNTEQGDRFGEPVAVSNDTVLVGAWQEDSNTTGIDGDQANNTFSDAGAAYVFEVPPPLPIVTNTFSYTGIVDALASGGFPDSASFEAFAGEPITVTFTYDLGTPDNNASTNGDYLGAVTDLEVTVGANVYTDIAGGDVTITNNGVSPDQFQVISFVTGPAVAGISETIQLRLILSDSTKTVFSSDALPLNQPDPEDFDLGAQINLQFADIINLCDFGNIITNAVACDPDCLTLFGSSAMVTRSQTLPVIDFGPLSFGLAALPVQLDVTILVGPGFPTGGGAVGYGLGEVLSANVIIGDGVFTELTAFDMEVDADRSIETLSATFAPINTPMVSAGGIVMNSPASISGTDIASGLAFSYTYGVSTDAIEFNILPDIVFPSFCNGDGGNQLGCTNCPCMNNAPPGTVGGCLNSAGTATRIFATGDTSTSLPAGPATTTDLRFNLDGAPSGAFCVLLSGSAVAPQNMGNACFGLDSGVQSLDRDGLRCAVLNLKRHGGRSANMLGAINDSAGPSRVWGGEAQPHGGIYTQGGFIAGETRYFQVTYREDPTLGCTRGLNTSQAIEVVFTP